MARRLHMDVPVQTGARKVESGGITQSTFMPSTMNAVRIHARGGPEFLEYEDAPIPQLVPDDTLVRVHATGITSAELGWDETYKNIDGSGRLLSIPGHEVSGAVETLSTGVTDLREGDEVYGLADFPRAGAAAEFVAIRASNLALRPKSVHHAGAAAASLSGWTAWQAKPAQFGARDVFFTAEPGWKMLTESAALIDEGAVNTIVSCTCPLMDAHKAFEASRTEKAPA